MTVVVLGEGVGGEKRLWATRSGFIGSTPKTAVRATFSAAARYFSISTGDTVSVPPMLSNPWPGTSGGKSSAGLEVHAQKVADGVVVLGPIQPPDHHAVGAGRLLPVHACDEGFQPGQHRLEFVVAGLRPLLGRHGVLAEHVQRLLDGRQALGQRLLVRELVEANVAALLVGVALEAVLGEERLNGPLILPPFGRGTGIGDLAAAAGRRTKTREGPRMATATAVLAERWRGSMVVLAVARRAAGPCTEQAV